MGAMEILHRLTGAPKPHKFAVFDIEAREWVKPYAVGVLCEGVYRQFDGEGSCIRQAIEYFLRPDFAGFWIYAHNGGNYDFLFFVRELLKQPLRDKYRVDLTPVGSTIIRIDVIERVSGQHEADCEDKQCPGCVGKRTGDRLQKWSFLDSAKLMPLPLADIGEAFGITKKVKLSMSYDDLARPENHEVMSHYLQTDCKSLYEAVGLMQEKINALGGQIGVTLPATSLDLFRRRFQKRSIHTNRHWLRCPEFSPPVTKGKKKPADRCIKETPDGPSCLHEFIRRSYFGGPAQIFRMLFVGKQAIEADEASKGITDPDEREASGFSRYPLTDTEKAAYDPRFPVARMYDINSHYPGMMLEAMPTGAAIELEGLTEDAIFRNGLGFVGIVECDVEIPRDCYLPPLPVTHQGKLMFPAGKLHGTWDVVELELLKAVGGRIVKSYRSVWFEKECIFGQFVHEMYKWRDKSRPEWNKALDWIAKILLNAAYGKYAMKELRTRVLMRPELHAGMKPIDLESDVWEEDVHLSPAYIVPQLASHIVALARRKLWCLNSEVIAAGGRLYYNDTDSLVVAGVEMDTGTTIGGLKVEATIHRAQFVLPKLYLVETDETNKNKLKQARLRIKSKGMGPGIRLGIEGDDPFDKQLSEEDFRNVTMNGAVITRHRLTKLLEGLRDYAKEKTEFPRVIESTKSIKSAYDKRKVLGDFNTKPLYLEQW
jgi:hypothetical protein